MVQGQAQVRGQQEGVAAELLMVEVPVAVLCHVVMPLGGRHSIPRREQH